MSSKQLAWLQTLKRKEDRKRKEIMEVMLRLPLWHYQKVYRARMPKAQATSLLPKKKSSSAAPASMLVSKERMVQQGTVTLTDALQFSKEADE